MTTIPINFDRMKANHPTRGKFKKEVPDWPFEKWHPCCAKLSYALNASGDPVVKYDYPDPVTGKARAWRSKRGQNYLMAVHDARTYLCNTYGDPERFSSQSELTKATTDRNGIIAFGLFHIDIWSDGNISHPDEFNIPVLWNKGNWQGEKLMFWDVGDDEVRDSWREPILMSTG